MPVLPSFSLPAFIQDFAQGSAEDLALKNRWNINVSGWIAQATTGAQGFFYDPVTTDIPAESPTLLVQWVAFPGRLDQFYSAAPPNTPANPYNYTQQQIFALADQYAPQGAIPPFEAIPATLCPEADWNGQLKAFGPYGPRGWLDEYCEWSAVRDANGNLLRADFSCENPEYWNTLWLISPQTVCSIYESVLNWDAPPERQISVTVADLQLFYNGQPVTDPVTGAPIYNPLNKWNNGPSAIRSGDPSQFSGGVMHLTSTPNTLQTELGLAGAATVQFQPPNGQKDSQSLICCGAYGQQYRHSDPHIGQSVNLAVGGSFTGGAPQRVCLADPVGLYLQSPDTSGFSFGPAIDPTRLPPGAQASDVYQVLRGSAAVVDPVTGQDFPGGMILHAVAQIPSAWLAVYPQMTLADIRINSQPIQWAGQIAEQFKVGLYARPVAASSNPAPASCAGSTPTPGAPLQVFHANVWDAFYNTVETAPTGQQMSLASNTTYIPPLIPANGSTWELVLTCNTLTSDDAKVAVMLADGTGPDPSITVTVAARQAVQYAVPGNSYPGTYDALSIAVTVPNGTPPGLRGVEIVDPSSGPQSFPALVLITAVADE